MLTSSLGPMMRRWVRKYQGGLKKATINCEKNLRERQEGVEFQSQHSFLQDGRDGIRERKSPCIPMTQSTLRL